MYCKSRLELHGSAIHKSNSIVFVFSSSLGVPIVKQMCASPRCIDETGHRCVTRIECPDMPAEFINQTENTNGSPEGCMFVDVDDL
jgi:hypothetical protein